MVNKQIHLYAWKENNIHLLAASGEAKDRCVSFVLFDSDSSSPVDLTGKSAIFICKHPLQKNPVRINGSVTDAENGAVDVVIPSDICFEPGSVDCVLAVSQNDGSVLKFVGIVIHVKEGLNLESAMQNSGKYDAYLSIVDEVQNLKTIVESSGSIQEVIVARGEYDSLNARLEAFSDAVDDINTDLDDAMDTEEALSTRLSKMEKGTRADFMGPRGKNLFNPDKALLHTTLDANGAPYDSGGYMLTDYIPFTPGTTLYFFTSSSSSSSVNSVKAAVYKADKSYRADVAASATYTCTNEENAYIRIVFPSSYFNTLMIQHASTYTGWEAYKPSVLPEYLPQGLDTAVDSIVENTSDIAQLQTDLADRPPLHFIPGTGFDLNDEETVYSRGYYIFFHIPPQNGAVGMPQDAPQGIYKLENLQLSDGMPYRFVQTLTLLFGGSVGDDASVTTKTYVMKRTAVLDPYPTVKFTDWVQPLPELVLDVMQDVVTNTADIAQLQIDLADKLPLHFIPGTGFDLNDEETVYSRGCYIFYHIPPQNGATGMPQDAPQGIYKLENLQLSDGMPYRFVQTLTLLFGGSVGDDASVTTKTYVMKRTAAVDPYPTVKFTDWVQALPEITPENCAFMEFDPDGQLLFESQYDYLGYIYDQNGSKVYGNYPTIRYDKTYFDFENRVYRIACNTYVTFWTADGTFVDGYARTSVSATNPLTITDIDEDYDYILLGLVGADKRMYGLPKGTLLAKFKEIFAANSPNLYRLENTVLDATLLKGYQVSPCGNLIDRKAITQGISLNSSGTGISEHNETDFIPVDPTKKYRLNFKAIPVFYDENKDFISGYNETVATPENTQALQVPENAVYMRTMIYDNQLDTAVLAENNYFQNDLPTYYTLNGVGDIGAHIAKKENDPLYGTTAIFFGDSTTAGSGDAAGGWPTWIYKRNLSMHCINCGVYGATFGSASAQWFDGADNQAGLPDEADYVIIQAYTNGMYGESPQKPVGTVSEFDYTVTASTADTTTYSGEAEKFVLQCLSRWHGKKLGMIIGYKATAHLAQNSPYRQFAEQIRVLCRKYSIPVLDLQNSSTIPCYTQDQIDTYFYKATGQEHGDGVHLNAKGNAIVSAKIEAWMKTL